ncbi:MAG: hypothetical protein WBA53_05735 [Burkholderiaceae bacterium]
MEHTTEHELGVVRDSAGSQTFSLLGGPLHRLGSRLGLVRGQTDTVRLGWVLGIATWLVLVGLALLDGVGAEVFSLKVTGAHVRLLVLLPMIFVCESLLDPRMASFVDWTLRARVVATGSLPDLEALVARVGRWKDSWVLELLILAAAVLMQALAARAGGMGQSWAPAPEHALAAQGRAAWWWWHVCLPLARFLLLRWLVRLALWTYFLWRVSRMELNLLPHHYDKAGGLGELGIVHRYYLPMIIGFGAVVSASFAEQAAAGPMAFGKLYIVLLTMLVIVSVLFLGPLLVFSTKLETARREGRRTYRNFAARYVQDFDHKWLGGRPADEPLLGTPDIQSLADLHNSAEAVRTMRVVPFGPGIMKIYAAGVVLPFLPLLLFKYPFAELAAMVVKRLFGG